MAERVGFVPVILSPINDFGLIRSPQSTKSSQSLSIRYETGTAQSRASLLERRHDLEPYELPAWGLCRHAPRTDATYV